AAKVGADFPQALEPVLDLVGPRLILRQFSVHIVKHAFRAQPNIDIFLCHFDPSSVPPLCDRVLPLLDNDIAVIARFVQCPPLSPAQRRRSLLVRPRRHAPIAKRREYDRVEQPIPLRDPVLDHSHRLHLLCERPAATRAFPLNLSRHRATAPTCLPRTRTLAAGEAKRRSCSRAQAAGRGPICAPVPSQLQPTRPATSGTARPQTPTARGTLRTAMRL